MTYEWEDEFHKQEEPKRRILWMLSFADLLSLMLTFFVMLYGMSLTEYAQWSETIKSIQERLGKQNRPPEFSLSAETATTPVLEAPRDLSYLVPLLRNKFAGIESLRSLQVRKYDDRLVITLPADLLFEPTTAGVTEKAKYSLLELAEVLNTLSNTVEMTGHDEPGARSFEISLKRAIHMASVLKELGYGREISVFGMGDSRYADFPPGMTDAQRREAARRVNLIIRETAG